MLPSGTALVTSADFIISCAADFSFLGTLFCITWIQGAPETKSALKQNTWGGAGEGLLVLPSSHLGEKGVFWGECSPWEGFFKCL